MLHFLHQGSMQIRVMETPEYRWLLFDDYLQSVMDKAQPHYPVLPHMHAQLLALFYQARPHHIVELGLGGGSLARYFQHFFPASNLTSIELEPLVTETYQQFFNPVADHNIISGDAEHLVHKLQNVDLLFVDLFNANSSPDFIFESTFYEACLAALSASGVLIVNVVPSLQLQSELVLELLSDLTPRKPDIFSAPGFQNRVFLLPANQVTAPLQYNDTLIQLCQRYQIELNHIVKLR
ncbi:MAG: hypothetical protein ACFHVJ_04605 [Aestuariibacter sp.]